MLDELLKAFDILALLTLQRFYNHEQPLSSDSTSKKCARCESAALKRREVAPSPFFDASVKLIGPTFELGMSRF